MTTPALREAVKVRCPSYYAENPEDECDGPDGCVECRDAIASAVLAAQTDDELRAEAARRGLVLHSTAFSQAAADVIRRADKMVSEIRDLKQRAEALGGMA